MSIAAETEPTEGALSGVALMLGFALLVPVMDVLAKLASAEATPAQISLIRFALQALFIAPFAYAMGRLRFPERALLGVLALRGALVAAATTFFFTALTAMPLADALAIFFVEPMILTALSAVILRETVGWRRAAACAVGFVGAMLIIQPKFGQLGWVSAAPLAAATCFSLYLILTRQISRHMDSVSIQLWSSVFALGPLLLALALGAAAGSESFRLAPISAHTVWLLLAMGAFATLGHLMITLAFSRAPASTLAPLQYLEIAQATLLGYLVFGDFPDRTTWIGVAIVVGSGLFILHRERALARAARLSAERAR